MEEQGCWEAAPHQHTPFTRGLVIFTGKGCGWETLLPLKELHRRHLHARPISLQQKTAVPVCTQYRYKNPKSRSGPSPHGWGTRRFIFLFCQCKKSSLTFPYVRGFGSQLCSIYTTDITPQCMQTAQQPEQPCPKLLYSAVPPHPVYLGLAWECDRAKSSKPTQHQDSPAQVPEPCCEEQSALTCALLHCFQFLLTTVHIFPFYSSTFLHLFSARSFYVRSVTIVIKELRRSSYANEVTNSRFGKNVKPTHSIYIEIF